MCEASQAANGRGSRLLRLLSLKLLYPHRIILPAALMPSPPYILFVGYARFPTVRYIAPSHSQKEN